MLTRRPAALRKAGELGYNPAEIISHPPEPRLNLYAADKLIAQARILAAEYRRTMGKPLPGISNEIAEYDAIKLLRLEARNEGEGGYDAIDPGRGGKRIQIKSRTIFDESKSGQRLGQMKLDKEWDSVVLVLRNNFV